MSRLINIFGKDVPTRYSGSDGTPLYQKTSTDSKVLCKIPKAGIYAEFLTAYQYSVNYQGIIGWIPGDSLSECYRLFGLGTVEDGASWIKVLCENGIGWILLDHIDQIFEVVDEQERLVYPYSPENWP